VTLNEALGGEEEAQNMSLVRPAMVKDPLTISALIGGDGGEGGEGGVKREDRGDLDRKEFSQLSLVYEVAGEGTVSGYEPPSHSHFGPWNSRTRPISSHSIKSRLASPQA
jgi:hypothetical protein